MPIVFSHRYTPYKCYEACSYRFPYFSLLYSYTSCSRIYFSTTSHPCPTDPWKQLGAQRWSPHHSRKWGNSFLKILIETPLIFFAMSYKLSPRISLRHHQSASSLYISGRTPYGHLAATPYACRDAVLSCSYYTMFFTCSSAYINTGQAARKYFCKLWKTTWVNYPCSSLGSYELLTRGPLTTDRKPNSCAFFL